MKKIIYIILFSTTAFAQIRQPNYNWTCTMEEDALTGSEGYEVRISEKNPQFAIAVINVNDPGGKINIASLQVMRIDKSWDRYIIFQGKEFDLRIDKSFNFSGVTKAIGIFKNDLKNLVQINLFCKYKK